MKISGKFILKVAGTLTVISLVVAALLGLVDNVTADKIAEIDAENTRIAMSAVVAEGSEFTDKLEISQDVIDAAAAQGGKLLRPAAECQLCGGTRQYPGRKPPPPYTAQRRRHGRSGQQGAKTGLFGRETLQRIAEAARQQGICPAEEHQREACPAGPQRKADTSQHQRPAPGQKCRTEPARPEPSGGHGRPHGAEQAEAVQ